MELINNKSALNNAYFVTNDVNVLLNKNISEVRHNPNVVNNLTVAGNKSTKLRLVLDLRHFNPHLFKYKHKYKNANTSRSLFTTGDLFFLF